MGERERERGEGVNGGGYYYNCINRWRRAAAAAKSAQRRTRKKEEFERRRRTLIDSDGLTHSSSYRIYRDAQQVGLLLF